MVIQYKRYSNNIFIYQYIYYSYQLIIAVDSYYLVFTIPIHIYVIPLISLYLIYKLQD